jgi:hypothetical protein
MWLPDAITELYEESLNVIDVKRYLLWEVKAECQI